MEHSRRHVVLALVIVSLALSAPRAWSGGGPESLFVVVNQDSWASRTVANAYVRLRSIPACNVLYLPGASDFDRITVGEFREKILKPILEAIDDRGLAGQIDCIAYSSDFPWQMLLREDFEPDRPPKIVGYTASLTGMTYLYQLVLARDKAYGGLNTNYYWRRAGRPGQGGAVPNSATPEERKQFAAAEQHMRRKKYAEALGLLQSLAVKHANAADVHMLVARCHSALKAPDKAVEALRAAVDAGWSDSPDIVTSSAFRGLLKRDDLKPVLDKAKENAGQVMLQQPVAFRRAHGIVGVGAWRLRRKLWRR